MLKNWYVSYFSLVLESLEPDKLNFFYLSIKISDFLKMKTWKITQLKFFSNVLSNQHFLEHYPKMRN
jgi:hypothetical protein